MMHATSGELTDYLFGAPVFITGGLSVGHVALTLVICIVLCFFKLCSIVDLLKQVFCDNTIGKQLVEVGFLYFIPWYITILFPVFNSNKLMIYLYWSTTNNYTYQKQLPMVWYLFFILLWHFCLQSNILSPTYFTYWTSLQLTINYLSFGLKTYLSRQNSTLKHCRKHHVKLLWWPF